MASLDDTKRGEIARKVLKDLLSRRDIKLNPQTIRELGDVAKRLNIKPEELKAFARELYQQLLDEAFGDPNGQKVGA